MQRMLACPRGEFELVGFRPLIFFLSAETSLCRLGRHCPRCWKGIGANVCVYCVLGLRNCVLSPTQNEIRK